MLNVHCECSLIKSFQAKCQVSNIPRLMFQSTALKYFSIPNQYLKSDIQYLLPYLSKYGATFDEIGHSRKMVAETRQQKSAHSSAVKEVCRQYSFALHIITPCANCATVKWDFLIQAIQCVLFHSKRANSLILWSISLTHLHRIRMS